MFTAPTPSAPTISTTTSPALPSSPTRSNRLRGLSYLRSYTHNHSHHHSQSGNTPRPTVPRSQTSNTIPSSEIDLGQDQTTSDPEATNTSAMPRESASSTATATRQRTSSRQQVNNEVTIPHRSTRNRAESAGAIRHQDLLHGGEHDKHADATKNLPCIRFIPHHDPRAPRPSLSFSTISRTLPEETAIIKVGRYSERDNLPDIPVNVPSSAPVGFKSKVVSRRHCEFWYSDGRWWIKDVKSSSGTFLNHIRLSQPGVESRPYEVKDGDVVQLGIDFRGGEEMIFRCVKIRVECNRGWQQGLNSFNKSTHARLRNLAKTKKDTDTNSTYTSECSICLMSIAPCQTLFVAPCSHVWHYKCIRPILQGPTAPTFLCPNCRAVTDLEADVDEPTGFDDSASENELQEAMENVSIRDDQPQTEDSDSANERDNTSTVAAGTTISTTAVSAPIPINNAEGLISPPPEGPMTPRNDAGPFAL